MSQELEDTFSLASAALAALRALGLAAAPHNIEVWYAHAEGRNPALSRDIQRFLGADGQITQEEATELYNRHILRGDHSKDVINLVARFEQELIQLSDTMEESGEKTKGCTENLNSIEAELKTGQAGPEVISKTLENIFSITRSIKDANQKLERQLTQSSSEAYSLRQSVERIQQEAMTDPLTGVKNRKVFDTAIENMLRDARNYETPLTLIIADIDHFKRFNDQWGHQTGDQVLRLVAEVMNANVKGQDILARYGGEEFAIILPDTRLENGVMLADKIRHAVESRKLKKRRTNESLGTITLSMGVALWRPGETSETLIERADNCLYAAKKRGRNMIVGEEALAEEEKAFG
ncbi:MAG: GGDEF domain-containing protein [Pseudomonadota bacterium]